MTEKTHHVSEKKKEIAKCIQKLVLSYPIIAAVDMENLPAPQLQQMRAQLRGKIELAMTKRRVIRHALEGIKPEKKGIEQLEPYLKGMPALIFTKENPFSLFKTLKKSKTSAPAKAGQTAPFDIKVLKGPTSFAPGPIIGELAQLRIKSGVEGGKVVIKEDSIIVKGGEKISAKAAEVLTRLGIKPMEVGLNVTAVYENGNLFTREILNIDEDKFMADLQKSAAWAFNLAVDIAYPTKETIKVLVGKAFNDAKALGLSQNIIDDEIIDELLSRAERSAFGLKITAGIPTLEKPKGEKKEAAKAEIPKEEPKAEEKPEEEFKEPEAEEKKPRVKPEIKEEPTATEKKEEEILEEEKKIIEEEKRLEEGAKKPKIESPVEEEAEKEVKEEEEKQLETERIVKEKEFEKEEEKKEEIRIEEKEPEEIPEVEEKKEAIDAGIKEEPQDETDKKIAEMVAKTKKFVKGEIPDAEKLIAEAGKLAAQEFKEKNLTPDAEKHKIKDTSLNIPSEARGFTTSRSKEPEERKGKPKESTTAKGSTEKKKKEQEEVENLARELIRKGTLRK